MAIILKISFERYMLQTYLERVLTVANQRLDRLTNSRYQFELNHEAVVIGIKRG